MQLLWGFNKRRCPLSQRVATSRVSRASEYLSRSTTGTTSTWTSAWQRTNQNRLTQFVLLQKSLKRRVCLATTMIFCEFVGILYVFCKPIFLCCVCFWCLSRSDELRWLCCPTPAIWTVFRLRMFMGSLPTSFCIGCSNYWTWILISRVLLICGLKNEALRGSEMEEVWHGRGVSVVYNIYARWLSLGVEIKRNVDAWMFAAHYCLLSFHLRMPEDLKFRINVGLELLNPPLFGEILYKTRFYI